MGRRRTTMAAIFRAFFLLAVVAITWSTVSSEETTLNLKMGRALLSQFRNYYNENNMLSKLNHADVGFLSKDKYSKHNSRRAADKVPIAFQDCSLLYDQAEGLMEKLLLLDDERQDVDDARMWLSGVITSHMSCLDGLKQRGWFPTEMDDQAQNLTSVLTNTLALYTTKASNTNKSVAKDSSGGNQSTSVGQDPYNGILKSWNPSSSKADIVVARDGSGHYRTIKEAVSALSGYKGGGGGGRLIVYIKAGVYKEQVIIRRGTNNVMFVGDGIGKTVVTGNRNYVDGDSTVSSATFAVFGDGFWARDMTFENTAGPAKHQAVAIMVSSDRSLFYRCSFRGYQDTLYAHSLRQFYRDCQIHGTVDFIFGDAAAVFQNCDIIVRRPMGHQSNMVTASGRDYPDTPTGFSIHGSRIVPSKEMEPVKGSFRTFLGRPWKRYARVVVWRTEMDGMIDPRGWTEWDGSYGLKTLFYAEYMNSGAGADTRGRVNWPGFHVLRSRRDVTPFNVRNFIQGDGWVAGSGVPVWLED